MKSSGNTDTQCVIAKILSAMSTAMFFLNDDVNLTAGDHAGFGYIIEFPDKPLRVNLAREELRRESQRKLRAVGGAE